LGSDLLQLIIRVVDWIIPFVEERERACPSVSLLAKECGCGCAIQLLEKWFNVSFIVVIVGKYCSVSDEI
jgi:hypothetical protein